MCAVIKNPLQRDGTSQQERLLKALLPENAKIDDRKIEDILAFATGYSKLTRYYNSSDQPDGDWSCFYEKDPCILLALLATTDTASIEAAFKQLEEKITGHDNACAPGDGENENLLPGYLNEIINLIYTVAVSIHNACKKLDEGQVLKDEIIAIIKKDIHLAILDNKQQDALIQLIGFDKGSIDGANDYSAFIQLNDNSSCICTKAWQFDQEGYDCIPPDKTFDLPRLKALFYVFFTVLIRVKQKAKIYFEACIAKDDGHQPHITLFLAFIYLFRYAIDHLNTLTRSHLLYYYEKVLCLHKQKETPDKVHVIFELAKNFNTHLIEEGVLLNAGKDDTGVQMTYALMEEVVVNKAAVEEIKTVYIDESTGIVHAAPKANSQDGIGKAFAKDEQAYWKTLGNAETPETEVGFALASPMFFLKEGLRAGMISYKFKKPDNLTAEQYSELIKKASSFRLFYSSSKEWIEIENVFTAVERILLRYPELAKLYSANMDKLQTLISNGFDTLKKAYASLYPETGTVVSRASVTDASPKDVIEDDNLSIDDFINFIEKVDVDAVAAFFISLDSVNPAVDRAAKDAAGESRDVTADSLKAAALKEEISQVRNDILALKQVYVNRIDESNQELDFFFVANTTALPFTPLLTDEKNPGIKSQWPIIKVLVKNNNTNGAVSCQYNDIKNLQINGVDIKVAAYGLKDIVVQNDNAILDNSKEIQPFTARPYKGSYFYIGSKEVFQKKLDFVGVQMDWAGKPASFLTHYANYITTTIKDKSFNTKAEILNNGNFLNVFPGNNQDLFAVKFNGKSIIALGTVKKSSNNSAGLNGAGIFTAGEFLKNASGFELHSFNRDPYINDFTGYDVTTRRGFLRLSLDPQDFLHDEYPRAVMKIVVDANGKVDPNLLPKEPYTPKLRNTSLFYISTERTLFGANNYNATIEQFYHITPFGYQQMAIDKRDTVFLLPQFVNDESLFTQGNLYIGLKDALPEQKVNILFQVLEGSGDNSYSPPDIEWSYLTENNNWKIFKPFEIQDHTRADGSSQKSLLRSGIIEFSLTKEISSEGATILNAQYLWIKACAHEADISAGGFVQDKQRIAALPDLVAIIAQAGIAEFKNNGNSLSHLAAPLPAKKITKFIDSRAAIKKADQPYYSFDGRLPENDNEFYRRTSERLRHKNRAICIWDYERLVLQAFPQVYKAKCLNHTDILENEEIAPGYVSIAVIPDLRNKNAANLLEPRVPVGMLDEIKSFLKKRTNLFVASAATPVDYLQVVNPLYEQIKVKACVRFYDGFDVAYYKYVLNEDLKKFLSPWAYDANKEISFGSMYHKSAILNFIEERAYVDVVLGFKVEHYVNADLQPATGGDWIIPTTSRSVLTSYNELEEGKNDHEIEFVPYKELDPCPACGIT